MYYKNTNEINAVESLLEDYDNIVAISSPDTYKIGKSNFFMIPWICADNYDETKSKISRTKSKVAFGHLEVNGFQAHRGFVMEHGMDKSYSLNALSLLELWWFGVSMHFHSNSVNSHSISMVFPSISIAFPPISIAFP